jgi:hypothetical protein
MEHELAMHDLIELPGGKFVDPLLIRAIEAKPSIRGPLELPDRVVLTLNVGQIQIDFPDRLDEAVAYATELGHRVNAVRRAIEKAGEQVPPG